MNQHDVEQVTAAFRACTLPKAQWTHRAHLQVGAWHVHHHGADAALPLLRDGIRKLNEHHGTANTPTGGYHETITAAYVQLIDAFLSSFPAEAALQQRVELLLSSPLAEKSCLLRFWSEASLMSPAARLHWVAPDLKPIALPR